jgi:hypothetical protein
LNKGKVEKGQSIKDWLEDKQRQHKKEREAKGEKWKPLFIDIHFSYFYYY